MIVFVIGLITAVILPALVMKLRRKKAYVSARNEETFKIQTYKMF